MVSLRVPSSPFILPNRCQGASHRHSVATIQPYFVYVFVSCRLLAVSSFPGDVLTARRLLSPCSQTTIVVTAKPLRRPGSALSNRHIQVEKITSFWNGSFGNR